MKRMMLAAAAVAMAMTGASAQSAAAPASLKLWRLDCGRFEIADLEKRGPVSMPVSCYLVRHDDRLTMFDAGLSADLLGKPLVQTGQTIHLDRTLAPQLAEIGIDPAAVSTLVVSHYHGDHHGQAGLFPNARLLIGAGDAAVLRKREDRGALGPWLSGQRPVEEVTLDVDLSGDGRVRVLATPGHTPGHLSMFVRTGRQAAYILTGDLVHERRQIAGREMSGNHVDKTAALASLERVIALADSLRAVIIVGHDKADVAKLPVFPAAAE